MPAIAGSNGAKKLIQYECGLRTSVPLVVRNGNYGRTRSQIAGVIAGTDCDRVLPAIQIVSVARRLQLDAERIAASSSQGHRPMRLDQPVLIRNDESGSAGVDPGQGVRDRSKDGYRHHLAVWWPQ